MRAAWPAHADRSLAGGPSVRTAPSSPTPNRYFRNSRRDTLTRMSKLAGYHEAIFGRTPAIGPVMQVALGAGAQHVSAVPIRVVPLEPPAGPAIASPPAAVLEMIAEDDGAVPAWPQTLTPPPSSTGQTVYGPYVYDGWLYAVVITPRRPHDQRQWYELYGPIP